MYIYVYTYTVYIIRCFLKVLSSRPKPPMALEDLDPKAGPIDQCNVSRKETFKSSISVYRYICRYIHTYIHTHTHIV